SGTMALAARLAQLYDDYQLYRPDALRAWASGETVAPGWPDEPWQADLWRHLLATAPDNHSGPVMDRATSALRLLDVLAATPEADVRLARVSLFGTTVVPPLFWRVLDALGRHVPVSGYAVTPAPLAPVAEPRHPLLRDLGGRTREWVEVMWEGASGQWPVADGTAFPTRSPIPSGEGQGEGRVGATPPEASGETPYGRPGGSPLPETTALAVLQTALTSDDPLEAPTELASGDRSIRIHECHSPLRELEVLRDEILDAFDSLDNLRPAEVGVLVPDMGTYAPLIDAVFGAERVAGVRIPYHVADPPVSPEARVLDAFSRVLALDSGRATASDLIGLLDVPVVRRAAGIHESELGILLEWVREARIHWGRDAAHKAAYGLPEDDVHTWRFGLDRLLVGYAIGPVDDVVLGRLPVAEAGLDGADLLGRFAEWATALFDALAYLRQRRPLATWRDDLLVFVDGTFAP
ncbi:MAG: exodeoxyribonuclease V subunit gamma, partial [Bacteroidota bacterium]